MVSDNLELPEISNVKIFTSFFALGLYNLIPLIVLYVCFCIAKFIPFSENILRFIPSIFTFVFYIAMSLSVVSIVKWQNENVFVAVFKSLKSFFKSKYAFFVFLLVFLCATLISYLSCTLIYAICLYFNFVNPMFFDVVHAIVNVCSLYVIANFYIGSQITILGEIDAK